MPAIESNPGEASIPPDHNENLYQQILAGRTVVDKIKDPEKRAFVERTQAAMETVAIGIHDLHQLPHDDQVEALDTVLDTVFDEDPEAQATIAEINEARRTGNEERVKELIGTQRKRYDDTRRELAFVLGVEVQDIEAENTTYRTALMKKAAEMPNTSDEEIMIGLGFLVPDQGTGKLKFAFPKENFPPHIVEKWDIYEGLVGEHTRARSKFDRALSDNSGEIVQLDALRRYAHNNLANAVQEFLQLEDWDLKRCRNFIEKMIEQRFPTIETRESTVTSEAVVRRLRAVYALGKIVHSEVDNSQIQ